VLLAKAGILDGRKATTNKDFFYQIANVGPKTHWVGKARWVVDGNVWTSSGVSAGTDAMISFIETLTSNKIATEVVTMMEWRRAETADDDPFAVADGTKDVLPKE
jgi:transcriptional regulator GlxA family with amidase domain